jgi:acyl carrier protein
VTTRERVEAIVREVLAEDGAELADATPRSEVPGWDSLAHVNIMFALEEELGVRFGEDELAGVTTFGDLVRTVERARAAA